MSKKKNYLTTRQVINRVLLGLVAGGAVIGSIKGAHEAGYRAGYQEALTVGACYGAMSVINTFGIPIALDCPVIPPELMPDLEDKQIFKLKK
jgi:hypothetical protein